MVFLGVSIGIFAIYRLASQPGCTGQTQLKVAVTPELAPAVKQTAQAVTERRAKSEGTCFAFDVTAADSADIAAAVAAQQGKALAGVGQPSGDIQVPDVWVPDSATWLARVQQAASGTALPEAASIARSPVVVAMPEPVAATLGWPNTKLTWQALLQQVTTNSKLHIGTAEPTRDAAALSGLLALGAAASGSPNGQAAATAALRTLASGR
ncbi:substrate-binding domain-containing protein, partial [Allorhizocola rhizosphaerae]|uniref:substrate-binding domain-containing protein n=1 Tax=Allorhizocola rhizosphaerae TaxID=1872709 RepID=UPI001FE3F7F2